MNLIASSILASFIIVSATTVSVAKNTNVKFSIKSSSKYKVEKTKRRQFDIGKGVTFSSGKPTIVGTAKHNCEVGFKLAPQNNGLTKKQINEFTQKKSRQAQVKAILGNVFNVSDLRVITVQGYKGLEMAVSPKLGPDHKTIKGMMVMIETPKGRMTQICMTKKAEYKAAVSSFRRVTKNVNLPD